MPGSDPGCEYCRFVLLSLLSKIMNRYFLENQKPITQLVYLILFIIICAFIVSMVSVALSIPLFGRQTVDMLNGAPDYTNVHYIYLLQFLQISSQIGVFLLPVFLWSYFTGGMKNDFAGLKVRPAIPILLYASLSVLVALPLIGVLSSWNESLSLPASLQELEAWMKDSEKTAEEMTLAFLDSPSWRMLAVNFFMVALFPALGEELVFRGALQRIFASWFRNHHAAILLSAFLFSAIHLQFYGFLPRFLMGIMFGYFFYWSGSLWIPVVAHFINNFSALMVAFLSAREIISVDMETFGTSQNVLVILLSTILTAIMVWLIFRQRMNKKSPGPVA